MGRTPRLIAASCRYRSSGGPQEHSLRHPGSQLSRHTTCGRVHSPRTPHSLGLRRPLRHIPCSSSSRGVTCSSSSSSSSSGPRQEASAFTSDEGPTQKAAHLPLRLSRTRVLLRAAPSASGACSRRSTSSSELLSSRVGAQLTPIGQSSSQHFPSLLFSKAKTSSSNELETFKETVRASAKLLVALH